MIEIVKYKIRKISRIVYDIKIYLFYIYQNP